MLASMSDRGQHASLHCTLTPTAKLLSLQAGTQAQKAGHSIGKWQGWDLNTNQHASVLPVCTQNMCLVHQSLGSLGSLKPGKGLSNLEYSEFQLLQTPSS